MVEIIGVRNTLIKLAVLVLVIKEIWLLLGIPAVGNAMVSFLMVGAIPGTTHTLSPDEVIRLVAILFVVFGLLIFRKEIIRLFRRQKAQFGEDPMPMPIDHPVAAKAKPKRAKKPEPILVIKRPTTTRRWLWRVQTAILLVWLALRVQVMRLSLFAVKYGQKYGQLAAKYGQQRSVWLWQTSRAYAILMVQYAVIVWRRTEPYLRRFDGWLERKLHEYEKTAVMLALGSEMTATVKKWHATATPGASSSVPSEDEQN